MRVKQVYCDFGVGFREGVMNRYGLTDARLPENRNPYEPLLLVGVYNYRMANVAIMHNAPVIVYWGGSDSTIFRNFGHDTFWAKLFRGMSDRIFHISTSHWITEDLQTIGLHPWELPVLLHDQSEVKPYPLGEFVYMYKADSDLYTGGIYHKIKSLIPYKIIETTTRPALTYSREQLMEAYKSSFIGLRFTEHDGLSETVCELGLMGRRVIHNGDTPNCIPYDPKDIDSIVEAIEHEYWHARNPNGEAEEVAKNMKHYLDVGEDWLDTDFYNLAGVI